LLRHRNLFGAASALCLLAAAPAFAEAPDLPLPPQCVQSATAVIDRIVRAEFAGGRIGAVTVGLVSVRGLEWTSSYGLADTKSRTPASADTEYRIGSITKQFTALMLLQLVAQGRVHLSDPVSKYVPEIASLQKQPAGAAPITLFQLATHTAGLDREPDDDELVYATGPVSKWEQQLLGTIPRTQFINEPGTKYSYSNIGYAILGLALSRAAGEPYVSYIHNHILVPLGMSYTAFELGPELERKRAKGFLIENGKVDAEEPELQERQGRGWRLPNGGLYSTVGDLSQWVSFELGREVPQVLSQEALSKNFSRLASADSTFTYGYGIGLQARRSGDFVALGHDGVLAGYQTSAWFDRNAGLGVVTLTTAKEDFLGFRLLRSVEQAPSCVPPKD
jgi:CubicO group peptidase (beta-lactamase class C family)